MIVSLLGRPMLVLFPVLSSQIQLPIWPSRYFLRGYWVIPSSQIHEPVLVTSDRTNGIRQVESVYGGLERTLHINTTDQFFYQRYRQDGRTQDYCAHYAFPSEFPDFITEYLPTDNDRWKYNGTEPVLGIPCHFWTAEGIDFEKTGWYFQFFAAVDDLRPVRFLTYGQGDPNTHPTSYVFDIEDWGPTISESEFLFPYKCTDVPYNASRKRGRRSPPYPQESRCEEVTPSEAPAVDLPDNFSWRAVNGVLPKVRHQSICGSCWAYASAEVLSAQVSLKIGSQTEISAQQIVDCTWGSTNFACDGGDGQEAYFWLANRSIPLVTAETYEYIGSSGMCPDKWTSPLELTVDPERPCRRFRAPLDDPTHVFLRKALFAYGPLVVPIRADMVPFGELSGKNAFYSDSQNCDTTQWTVDYTDHDVMLTGWQTIGGKVWLEIQNSWSTDWGLDGYAWIDGQYHCGIPMLVLLPIIKTI
jgi:hypothetical protein